MRQQILTILSVGFLFFILGFLGLTLMTSYSLLDFWKQKLMVIVELNDNVEETDLNRLQTQLENAVYTSPNTLDIITKEEAAEMMREDYGEDFLSQDLPNPLHHVYTFNVTKEYSDTLALEGIRKELVQNNAVFNVYYEANLSQKVSKNLSNLLWYAIGLSILFIFVAVYIVRQSVIISIQNAKSLINNEEELWRFPTLNDFLTRNTKNGLLSGVIAVSGLILASYWLGAHLGEITSFLQNRQIVIFLSILFIISVLVYTITTYFTYKLEIKKFINF
jgi:cell division transport system permease protein